MTKIDTTPLGELPAEPFFTIEAPVGGKKSLEQFLIYILNEVGYVADDIQITLHVTAYINE